MASKILHDVFSRVVAGIILAILAVVWTAVHFDWWKEALLFLVTTSPVPHWLLTVLILTCLILAILAIPLAWKSHKLPRPRWFTWNELDWQLLGKFFAEGYHLKPEHAGNLNLYIRGPFCRNPACKREVRLLNVEKVGGFSNSLAICPSSQNTTFSFHFGQKITGVSEERAVLVEACKEAQAASRRGERFRASQ